jgi:pimeloyl-ACP methyl ester carboxylesterase
MRSRNCPRLVVLAVLLVAGMASPSAANALEWGPCPPIDGIDPRQECTSVTVPLDYSAPKGERIEIAVSRIPAESPQRRRGVLVYNPGGPGESGIYGPTTLAATLPAEVRDRYDLIGFDPRGINFSAPVSCNLAPEDLDVVRFIPYPAPDGDISQNVSYSRRAAAGCASSATADHLPHITTANTARDMNRIRAALGERRISYLGYSYGTYLGSVYAELFPSRTDRFVLDSVVHPRRIWRSTFAAWGPAAEVAFPGFARFAAERNDTYGLGATPSEVREKFFELLAEVEAEPFVLDGFVIDHRWFRELVRTALRSETSFPELALIWQLIDQREPASARRAERAGAAAEELRRRATPTAPDSRDAAAAVDYPVPAPDNPFASPWAVVCGDADWPESPATYQRDVRVSQRLFPMIGPAAANIWPCAFWPFEPRDPVVEIDTLRRGKALLVQSFRDPATPYDGGLALRATLGSRARLVSVGNGGHAMAFGDTNACADERASTFLATGALPARDVVCEAEPPTAARAGEASRRRRG